MIGKGLVNRVVATLVAAGAAFVAVIALGATFYYALALVLVPLGAAAVTAGLFAFIALVVCLVFLKKGHGNSHHDAEDEDEPHGMGGRALRLFQERPVLGTVVALAGSVMILRNPALATILATAVTQKSRRRSR